MQASAAAPTPQAVQGGAGLQRALAGSGVGRGRHLVGSGAFVSPAREGAPSNAFHVAPEQPGDPGGRRGELRARDVSERNLSPLPACPVGPLPRVARPSSVSVSAWQLSSFMRVQSRAGGAWEGTDRLTARRSAPFSAERGVRLPAALPVALPGAISAPRPNGEAGCHVWPLKPGSPWWGAGQPCPGRGTTAWGLAPDRGRLPITLRGPPGRG